MPNDTTPAPTNADALRQALELCSAELFAQCADQPRAMQYVEQARAALASAAQPERVPLTDVQIDECLPLGVAGYSALIGDDEIRAFARAVEAAHGIKPAKEDEDDTDRLRDCLRRAILVIEDFMPNIGRCVLQDYERLNNVLCDSQALLTQGGVMLKNATVREE